MIERVIREFYPQIDTAPIENIRVSKEPAVRDAILWEYGLTPLLSFAVDPKLIDEQAVEFIRLRGTLAAIRLACAWVGFSSITFTRLNRTDYEIDPGRVPSEREIKALRAALSVAVQARGILKRIYNGTFEVRYG